MERHKLVLAFALGIIATIFAILLFRMVSPFVAGAGEIFFTGVGIGILVGIIISVWIVRKMDKPEQS